jgi:hypothetical protein
VPYNKGRSYELFMEIGKGNFNEQTGISGLDFK